MNWLVKPSDVVKDDGGRGGSEGASVCHGVPRKSTGR
jgi:hypothetical protein